MGFEEFNKRKEIMDKISKMLNPHLVNGDIINGLIENEGSLEIRIIGYKIKDGINGLRDEVKAVVHYKEGSDESTYTIICTENSVSINNQS